MTDKTLKELELASCAPTRVDADAGVLPLRPAAPLSKGRL